MTKRNIFGIFLLALIFRTTLFGYNHLFLDLEPFWSWQARVGLILALSDFGEVPLTAAFETSYKMSVEGAMRGWPVMDRGIVYVHLLLKALFGTTSYAILQSTHIIFDALLVFPIMSIAYYLSDSKKIMYSIGLLYSAFLPQLWLSIQPDYNAWLTTGYIVATWLYLKIVTFEFGKHHRGMLILYAVSLLVVVVCVNQIRSTIILLPIGMAAWFWVMTLLTTRPLVFPRYNWLPALSLICVGILVLGISGTLNNMARENFSPVRSTFGHAFWTGVGQYRNPYGLADSDGSVAEFYKKETGLVEVDGTTGGVEYNAWLTERGGQFIKENPVLYGSMVVRRALGIIFPNMPFTVIADKPSYDRTPIEIDRTESRIKLQQKYGKLSATTILTLALLDPFYIVGLFCRMLLMVLLPLGCILFVILSDRRSLGLLALMPLAYHTITLSPIYVTPIILIPAYAAVLPVVVIGWCLAVQHGLGALRARSTLSDPRD